MKMMNMIEDMGGKPIYNFSFYEVLLFSAMIMGCIVSFGFMIASIIFCIADSPWFLLMTLAAGAVFCFCLTVVIFVADE